MNNLLIIQVFFGVCLGLQIINKKYFFKKTFLFKTTTCFPDEDDEYDFIKNINNYTNILLENAQSEFELLDNHEKPLYTLIWYDCEESKEIINHMIDQDLKHIFINLDILDLKEDYNIFPLLYKEEECVGDNLFDIYKEIYL